MRFISLYSKNPNVKRKATGLYTIIIPVQTIRITEHMYYWFHFLLSDTLMYISVSIMIGSWSQT